MTDKYKEIFRLKEMLEKAKIPFEFVDKTESWGDTMYQIGYPKLARYKRVCSVVEGYGTLGDEDDLLDIKGLTINPTSQGNEGYLTAEEVFKRIKEHYEGVRK